MAGYFTLHIPRQFNHVSHPRGPKSGVRLPYWSDLNAAALAEYLCVNVQHLRLVLTGRRNGSKRLIAEIVSALDISESEFRHTQRLSATRYVLPTKRGDVGRRRKKAARTAGK